MQSAHPKEIQIQQSLIKQPPIKLSPIGVLSRSIVRIPFLDILLDHEVAAATLGRFRAPISAIAGWGHKPTAHTARRFAQKRGLPYIALEDGFLRSVGLGNDAPPQSLIIDDVGIYYNASGPSRLESLAQRPLTAQEHIRSQNLIMHWRQARVSKYNHAREYTGALPERYVLVADQTLGDASVALGQADAASFARMLNAALEQHPEHTVLVKVHPEVMAGSKAGYYNLTALTRHPRIQILGLDAHPVRLLECAAAVYTVTSQLGFEALLWGKPVYTFGMPFYAGWGLTQDRLARPMRRTRITIEQLTHAALIEYPRYIHPETHACCQPEALIDWIEQQRGLRSRFVQKIYALNFSWNKRPSVRQFLSGSEITFVRAIDNIPLHSTIAVWGSASVGREDLNIIRLEDGFIRSVGLGADLIRPTSWVADSTGIYYDATRPSDLETILQTFTPDLTMLARAIALRHRIVEAGISKYNLNGTTWVRPSQDKYGHRVVRVILVPGQVESDASLRHGAPRIQTNIALLQAVRAAHPSAYIVYKPHPDVVAGLRAKGADEKHATTYCDEVVTNASINHLLNVVDEVHVMTSLTGFEALLRGRSVVTYGQPFYAGWGLTQDLTPPDRRTRTLSLNQLVAGTLIVYPTYIQAGIQGYCTPEAALTGLVQLKTQRGSFHTTRATLRRMFALATSSRR